MQRISAVMKVLYASSVDISVPNGPGVNEREFLAGVFRDPSIDCHAIIPFPERSIDSDIRTESLTFVRPHSNRKSMFWVLHQISLMREVHRRLHRENYDCCIVRVHPFSFGLWISLRLSNTPYAVKTAGSGQFNFLKSSPFGVGPLSFANKVIFRDILSKAVVVDVVSDVHANSLRQLYHLDNVTVVDNGVNVRRFTPTSKVDASHRVGLEPNKFVIGYVGNDPWERGGREVVRVLAALKDEYPDMAAIVLGGGDSSARVRIEAERLGVEDSCIIPGQVPYDEVVYYINALDIGFSILAPHSQGASEQKVRQYMACGKYVITTPGSSGFVAEEGLGMVVEYEDHDGLVNSVRNWRGLSGDERLHIAQRAVEYARAQLSVDSRVHARFNLYTNLI